MQNVSKRKRLIGLGAEPSGSTNGLRRPRQAAALALAPALEPLVDLCLELGVTSPELERIVRSVFVQRALAWLSQPSARPQRPSDLRVGLMIGVHRNFVRQIRTTKPRAQLQKVERRHRSDALLQCWATEWPYLTNAGLPRELPLRTAPNETSFEDLVSRFMPGTSINTALAELRRSGTVQLLPDERVRLRSRKTRAQGIGKAGLISTVERLRNLVSMDLHNLRTPGEPRFCEDLGPIFVAPERMPIARQTIARRARNFLDTLAMELESEATDSTAAVGVGLTVFSHESPKTKGRKLPPKR